MSTSTITTQTSEIPFIPDTRYLNDSDSEKKAKIYLASSANVTDRDDDQNTNQKLYG
jgi:hypothetical protein